MIWDGVYGGRICVGRGGRDVEYWCGGRWVRGGLRNLGVRHGQSSSVGPGWRLSWRAKRNWATKGWGRGGEAKGD